MSPALTQISQSVQSAASTLDASLPQLTAQGRLVLQELFAALISGGQSIGTSIPVDAALSAAVDVGIDQGISSLDQNISPEGNSNALDAIRHEFKRELRSSMSHVAELPPQHHERSGRSSSHERNRGLLSSLSIPSTSSASDEGASQRKPFLRL